MVQAVGVLVSLVGQGVADMVVQVVGVLVPVAVMEEARVAKWTLKAGAGWLAWIMLIGLEMAVTPRGGV